jgi:peptide/nickel transport system substrate-binding protein
MHLKKSFTAVLLAILVSILGCKRTQVEQGKTFSYGIENDLTNLDPIKSQEPYSLQVIGQIFEGLVTLDGENKVIPVLAEDWSHNEDFSVWRFKIRRGVFFHQDPAFGTKVTREVTAEDVRYSFERIVSKDSYPSFVLTDILAGVKEFQEGKSTRVSGLSLVDTNEVEFRLIRPEPYFLNRITSPWFCVFPKEVVELGPDVFGRTKAVGTGPFRLVSRSDNEVVLERNDSYWQRTGGNIRTATFKVIKNDQFRLAEVRNNNVSMTRVPFSLVPALGAMDVTAKGPVAISADHIIQFFPTFNTHFIGFNCEKVDADLRRAISFALDRKEIGKVITNGVGVVTTGTIPPGLQGYVPPYDGDIFNLDSARFYQGKATARNKKPQLELLVHDKDNAEQLGELVQVQLAKIGIHIRLEKLDYNTVVERMIKGETECFALAFEYVFSAPQAILNNVFNSDKIPVPNFWRYKNSKVDELLSQLSRIEDRSSANKISQQIERIVIRDAPAAFLYQSRNLVIYSKKVSGVSFNGHSIPLIWDFQVE